MLLFVVVAFVTAVAATDAAVAVDVVFVCVVELKCEVMNSSSSC